MMIIHIAILEDAPSDYQYLETHIKNWGEQTGNVIHIEWYQNESSILHSKKLYNCHILFSDIELVSADTECDADKASTGIHICSRLRENGFKGEIIFLTAYREYVFEGYDVQAFNYLLKPIRENDLEKTMNKYLSLHQANFYYHHKGNDIIQIPYNDIVSISKDGHDILIQTAEGIYAERTALNKIEKHLPAQFLRCHKSCIINTLHIKSLSGNTVKLTNNQIQTVGRIYLDDIRKALLYLSLN